jgi:hypothetical protein
MRTQGATALFQAGSIASREIRACGCAASVEMEFFSTIEFYPRFRNLLQ